MTSQYGILQTISAFHFFMHLLMDQAIMSFKERFEQLKRLKEIFYFWFNLRQFDMLSPDTCAVLGQHCHNLKQILSLSSWIDSSIYSTETDEFNSFDSVVTDRVSEIDGIGLFDQLWTCAIFCLTLSNHLLTCYVTFMHRLYELLPNVSEALRILLTVPVTVASGERSFSKLNLLRHICEQIWHSSD